MCPGGACHPPSPSRGPQRRQVEPGTLGFTLHSEGTQLRLSVQGRPSPTRGHLPVHGPKCLGQQQSERPAGGPEELGVVCTCVCACRGDGELSHCSLGWKGTWIPVSNLGCVIFLRHRWTLKKHKSHMNVNRIPSSSGKQYSM